MEITLSKNVNRFKKTSTWENLMRTRRYLKAAYCLVRSEARSLGQARTARDINGLPKVSLGPAMPDPSTPCGRATPEMALRSFLG
jgi:hypothetical protein